MRIRYGSLGARRFETARGLQVLPGLGRLALLRQRVSERVLRRGARRIEANRLAELREGAVEIVLGHPLPPDAQREDRGLLVRLDRVQSIGLRERGRCPCGVLLALQDLPDAQIRLRRLRLDLDRRLELGERLVLFAKLAQHRPEHVVRLRVRRLHGERRAKLVNGLGQPPRLPQHHAQSVVRICEVGAEAHGLAQGTLGALEVILLLQRRAEIVEGLGICRFVAHERLKDGHGAGEVRLLQQRRAEVQSADAIVRVGGDE